MSLKIGYKRIILSNVVSGRRMIQSYSVYSSGIPAWAKPKRELISLQNRALSGNATSSDRISEFQKAFSNREHALEEQYFRLKEMETIKELAQSLKKRLDEFEADLRKENLRLENERLELERERKNKELHKYENRKNRY